MQVICVPFFNIPELGDCMKALHHATLQQIKQAIQKQFLKQQQNEIKTFIYCSTCVYRH